MARTFPCKTLRKEILEALKARLLTMTKDNGYSFDLKEATIDLDPAQERADHEMPVIYIVPSTERSDPNVGGNVQRVWTLDLLFAARHITDLELVGAVDEIENALLGFKNSGDYRLDCLIHVPRVVEFSLESQMLRDKDNISMALVTIELEYRTNVFRK